ncbi:heavy-metal-associated domain-containing protein [Lentimicrobium sp. S6]|uniref:heavy-metal-associated domain-containing protein n=1 Tax=Lentimicrobium sp. S6 TaxID=2735872 RepID=UPI0015577632|nr:cation transporter [Lentimicrobium sp. S6]NPD44721.1 ATPase [Lentimicrobium sp. S6]
MKNIISVLALTLLVLMMISPADINAQKPSSKTIITDSLFVRGVCNSCKERIENAALIKGVKKVSWNKKTQYLTVIYKPSKISLNKIEDEVVLAGHDTKDKKALDKNYNKLPACCAYRSGIAPH